MTELSKLMAGGRVKRTCRVMGSAFVLKVSQGLLGALCSVWLAGAVLAQGWVDRDRDGVPDSKDACPHSRPNVAVDAMGCEIRAEAMACMASKGAASQLIACEGAEPGKSVEPAKQASTANQGASEPDILRVYFAFGSAEVGIDQWPQLAKVHGFLKASDAKLTLVGHTDNVGSEAVNMNLSRQRAERVKQIFVQDYGVEAQRLSIVAKGASQPVTDNDGPGGRALNRRVEFIVEAR